MNLLIASRCHSSPCRLTVPSSAIATGSWLRVTVAVAVPVPLSVWPVMLMFAMVVVSPVFRPHL
jgi:hypothetical protein